MGPVKGGQTRFTGAGSDASAGASDAKQLQASEMHPDMGLRPDVQTLALLEKKKNIYLQVMVILVMVNAN
jgi:hypothetical protein